MCWIIMGLREFFIPTSYIMAWPIWLFTLIMNIKEHFKDNDVVFIFTVMSIWLILALILHLILKIKKESIEFMLAGFGG